MTELVIVSSVLTLCLLACIAGAVYCVRASVHQSRRTEELLERLVVDFADRTMAYTNEGMALVGMRHGGEKRTTGVFPPVQYGPTGEETLRAKPEPDFGGVGD